MEVHLLHGAPRSGKTTALADLVQAGRRRGWALGGFLARGRWRDGRRDGFDLEPAAGGRPVPLSRAGPVPDGPVEVRLDEGGRPRVGRFRFEPAGLEAGRRALERAGTARLVVVDEVGFLELAGGGWDPWLRRLLARDHGILVLVVRDELVQRVVQRYGLAGARCHLVGDPGWPESVLDGDGGRPR